MTARNGLTAAPGSIADIIPPRAFRLEPTSRATGGCGAAFAPNRTAVRPSSANARRAPCRCSPAPASTGDCRFPGSRRHRPGAPTAPRSAPHGSRASSSSPPASFESIASLPRLDEPPRPTLFPLFPARRRESALRHLRQLHALPHRGHAALTDHLQHAAHLGELLQQAVHLFHRGPAPRRDSLAAAAVHHRVIPPLVRRHRADDRFDASHLLFVRLVVGKLLEVAEARNHPEDAFERSHAPNRLELLPEVVERELVLPKLLLELLGL